MNILAIDTTSKKASVALKKDNKVISKCIDNEITHSEKLLPLIDEVLKSTNTNLKDIDLFACTLGPGSFTGVRIGIATVKALAKVYNKKIYGITSLELLALNGIKNFEPNTKYVLSLLDAKNSRAYYNVYLLDKDVNNNTYLKDTGLSGNLIITDLAYELVQKGIQDVLVIGDVTSKFKEVLSNSIPNSHFEDSKLDIEALIENITEDSSKYYDYLTLDAMYYRNSEAERTKNGEK